MTRWCIVPHCKNRQDKNPGKVTFFKVGKKRVETWGNVIPRGKDFLKPSHHVCESHFEERYIKRKWVSGEGEKKVEITLQCPMLTEDAIPTLFDGADMKNLIPVPEDSDLIVEPYDSYVEPLPPIIPGDHIICDDEKKRKNESRVEIENVVEPYPPTIPDDHIICDDEKGRKNESRVEIENVVEPYPPTIPDNHILCDDEKRGKNETPVEIENVDINEIKFNLSEIKEVYFSKLPAGWTVSEVNESSGNKTLVFYHTKFIKRMSVDKILPLPIIDKSVIFESNGELKYCIYNKKIKSDQLLISRISETNNLSALMKNLLKNFQAKSLCCGVNLRVENLDYCTLSDKAEKDILGVWRHKDCHMLSSRKRCENCQKLSFSLYLSGKRSSKNPLRITLAKEKNLTVKKKLIVAKRRYNSLRREKNRLKVQIDKLKKKICDYEEKLSTVEEDALTKLLEKLHINEVQKEAIQEIIKAAKTKSPKGRRYSKNWIMQCMLLSIRNASFYEHLRKNEILPLPSIKTVRNYFSLIDTKCGLDKNYAKILKKYFQNKTSMQKHGIIVIDELKLRKSVKVSSRNLTYSGLIDFGEDGPKADSIDQLADYGLVMMFQPLCDNIPQPFACFASRNSVEGKELAKIVIEAIIYLEKCGAKIHAVNGDGASTNNKMFDLFDINKGMTAPKTYFTHPLDDDRKVFCFSDVPHLIKNVRNRLFNNKVLRVDPSKNYIQWAYIELLYILDNDHDNQARACPKLTKRHIYLDQMSKMRVRLAVQVLSDSVAKALELYSKHYPDLFKRVDETINFCSKFNKLFDALNIKDCYAGLTKDSPNYQILKESLEWLNKWEKNYLERKISDDEFLTEETAHNLRLSILSTMGLCDYLTENFNFKYVLTGRINQDNLEKFFGIVRQYSGSNDHPDVATFLQVYKLLSIYSSLKPPKYGNCTVTDEKKDRKILITLDELQEIYGKKKPGAFKEHVANLKQKLDEIINSEKEIDEVIEIPDHNYWNNSMTAEDLKEIKEINTQDHAYYGSNIDIKNLEIPDHDYCLSPLFEVIIYYTTGYLVKQLKKKCKGCINCNAGLINDSTNYDPQELFVGMKSRGGLIHANKTLFHLILHAEECLKSNLNDPDCFSKTLDDILINYEFKFQCEEHASEILSFALCYYIRMRLLHFTHQLNKKPEQKYSKIKKTSKFTDT